MAKRRLPRGVTKHGSGYRAWINVRIPGTKKSRKTYGPTRETPEEAGRDAERMRLVHASLPNKIPRLVHGIDFVRQTFGSLRSDTCDFYEQQFRAIGRHFDQVTPLHSIGRNELEEFVRVRLSEGVSPSTIRHHLRTFRRIFRVTAREVGFELPDATKLIRNLPRQQKAAFDWFTRDEVVALLQSIDRPDDRDVVELIWLTGARRSGLGRLERGDIDFRRQQLVLRSKTGERVVPISRDAAECLQRIMARPRRGGGLVVGETFEQRRDTISRCFKRWQRELDEPRFHAHAIRHSFGTELARQGVHPTTIANLMGHASLAMAMKYCHVSGHAAREALDRLSLRDAL